MPENKALWINKKRGPFTIGPAPYTAPRAGQIVVRARAVAVNPVDRLQQTLGDIFTPWTSYPFVVGSDVAGEIVEVGSSVTRFAVGDRVVGYASGSDKGRNRAAEGAFQEYVVLLAHMTSPIPDAVSFEAASVIPLGVSTAACGMFQKDFLGMNAPSATAAPAGKTLIVWGGSTSVGSNAIQLAVAAGYDVVATASPRNFAYVKGLGAREAFDYNSKTVVADIVKSLGGREIAGALAIGVGSAAACIDIVGRCKGDRFVAMATPPTSWDDVPAGRGRFFHLLPALARMIIGAIGQIQRARRRNVRTKMIWGSALITNEVGPMIFEAFLPLALAEARFVAAPRPTVVGVGLAQIPVALERQRQGVSAAKLVVML